MIFLKKKSGQSSIEFVLIAGLMFLILMGMVMAIQSRMSSAHTAGLYNSLDAMGNLISTEIRVADSIEGYYSRNFFLPEVVGGFNYSIGLYNKAEIVIEVEEIDYVIFLDYNVSGDIGKRWNTITNDNGYISITN